jgi:hypothetical protein
MLNVPSKAARATLLLCLLAAGRVCAQQAADTPSVPAQEPAPQLTVFPHPDTARWLLSGQANIIFQAHPGFHSPYSGANSMLSRGEYKTSLVGTLFAGFELNPNPRFETDLIYDEESAGGRGISEALGLAGFTNLDVVRNPQLGPVPYMARVQVHQTIGLTSKLIDQERTQFSLATRVPQRRLDLRFGKMGLPDFLDINDPGSDSHLQFLNWTVDNNGAWDYAADTRGYTYAFVAEYDDVQWSARYALALMPTMANGIDYQWNLHRARGNNYELEYRKTPFALLPERLISADRKGSVRLLGYANYANMGDYRVQNNLALAARAHGNPYRNSRHHRTPARNNSQVRRRPELPAGTDPGPARLRPLRLERGPARELRLHRGRSDLRARRRPRRQPLAPSQRQARRRRRLQRHQARPPDLPRARGPRLPARRRPPELRPRGHPGDLLHRPQLARPLHLRSTPSSSPILATTRTAARSPSSASARMSTSSH